MKHVRHLGATALLALTAPLHSPSPTPAQTLPIVEVTAVDGAPSVPGRPLGFLLSGDGDWVGADKEIATVFATAGIPVVGLKARSYLRGAHRTPDGTADDVAAILTAHLARWSRESVILVGYSRGADLMPFIVNRLPEGLKRRVRMVVLLGPQPNASFTFHFLDLVKDKRRSRDLPVLPEIERIEGIPVVCVYGQKESGSLCPTAPPGLMEVVRRPGGHRLGDEGEDVAEMLLRRLGA